MCILFFVISEQTIDLGFPGAGLLVSSCQYTMVPLRGVSTPQANGLRYANGVHLPVHQGPNGHFPPATIGYPAAKPQDYSPDEVYQVLSPSKVHDVADRISHVSSSDNDNQAKSCWNSIWCVSIGAFALQSKSGKGSKLSPTSSLSKMET